MIKKTKPCSTVVATLLCVMPLACSTSPQWTGVDFTTEAAASYTTYLKTPLATRAAITKTVASLSFHDLSLALPASSHRGTPKSLADLDKTYPSIQAYLSAISADPDALDAPTFTRALQQGATSTDPRLEAEVALNLSIMALLARLPLQSKTPSQGAVGLSLTGAVKGCAALPQQLRNAISDWVGQDPATNCFYNCRLTPSGVTANNSHYIPQPKLWPTGMSWMYSNGKDDEPASYRVRILGTPSDPRLSDRSGLTTTRYNEAGDAYSDFTPLTSCQQDQIYNYVDIQNSYQKMSADEMSDMIAKFWQPQAEDGA